MRLKIIGLDVARGFVTLNLFRLFKRMAIAFTITVFWSPVSEAERLACYNFTTACRCFPTIKTGRRANKDAPQLRCNGRKVEPEETVALLSFTTSQKFIVQSNAMPEQCSNPCSGEAARTSPLPPPTQLNPPIPIAPPATTEAPPAQTMLGGPHPVLPPPVPYPNGVWDGETSPPSTADSQADQVAQQADEPAFPPATGPSELPAPPPTTHWWTGIFSWLDRHAAKDENVNLGTVGSQGSH